MAEILPFRALYYDPARVRLSDVVTQPYDKISAEMQARYYAASPYNLARIIRRRAEATEENPYLAAARDFQAWIRQQILVSSSEPALFAYDQEFTLPGDDRSAKTRHGLIALVKLEDYSAGIVYRHEETLSGPKEDRLELLKATRAHFGQLFLLYSDPSGTIERELAAARTGMAWERVEDAYHTFHSVWRIEGTEVAARITGLLREKKLLIADGHHRYETALAYRDWCRERARASSGRSQKSAEYVMATLVRLESPGLTILPTHRVIHSLANFNWQRFVSATSPWFQELALGARPGPSAEGTRRLQTELARAGQNGPAFVAYGGSGKAALLGLRPDADLACLLRETPLSLARLDVVVLHRLLLERALGIDRQAVREERNVRYAREAGEALAMVDRGEAQLCFLLNPTPIGAASENALAGLVLPQKSTDFYPKMLSGLAIYWLDNPLSGDPRLRG